MLGSNCASRALIVLAALGVTDLYNNASAATWTNNASGNASGSWATPGNWNSGAGPVPGGQDVVADFSTLDITTDSTITLDGDRVVGSLAFGDTPTASNGWVVTSGTPSTSSLTLSVSSGSPTITASRPTTISAPLSGTQGFTKEGTGTLTLGGNNTGLTGGIRVNAGTLAVTAANQLGGNPVTLKGSTLSLLGNLNFASNVAVETNSVITGNGSSNELRQLGTLSVASGQKITINDTPSGFAPQVRFNGLATIGGAATFESDIGATNGNKNGSTHLTLNAGLTVSDTAAVGTSVATFQLATTNNLSRSRNITLGGTVSDNASDPTKKLGIRLRNAGTGKAIQVTMTGTNTYTGLTEIQTNGTLTLNGSLATSNILIGGGSLTGSGTINYLVNGSLSQPIQITSGTLNISALKLNVSLIAPTLAEYVIADKAVGSANIVGTVFGSELGVPAGWHVDYDGTPTNPNAIVLVVPEPASIGLMGAAMAMIVRRRRNA